MSILVITTGGTIGAMPYDPLFPPKFKVMPKDGRDLVHEALSQHFGNLDSHCIALEHRDSQLINDAYRENLLKTINDASETKVLITHGTDTLLETAGYFYNDLRSDSGLKNKVVLLTGAMVPLSNGSLSDGYMNLKYALEQLSAGQLAAGIYIVLCDYIHPETKEGWQPRLYSFVPGRYEKYYNQDDTRFSRLRAKA